MNTRLIGIWESADSATREAGAAWYPSARAFCDSLAFWTDTPLHRMVGACSALSPQLQWKWNKEALEQLVKEPSKPLRMVLGNSTRKAKAILAGRLPLPAAFPLATCPKTNNFYHNILNPTDARYVTIDTHAARAATGAFQAHFKYAPIANEYLEAARFVGVLPSTFQATVWTIVRNDSYRQMELFNNVR